tara:strand:- start:86 stop:223 length:138 start_codon:yes stop_codon:yes gene_type:complete
VLEALTALKKAIQVDALRVFIPSKNYEDARSFYQAMEFKIDKASL